MYIKNKKLGIKGKKVDKHQRQLLVTNYKKYSLKAKEDQKIQTFLSGNLHTGCLQYKKTYKPRLFN
jgi:hypothetical protein